MAAAVEHEYPFGKRIVEDGIGILPCLHLGHGLERFQVKNSCRIGSPVTDKTAIQPRRHRNPMHARSVGNITCQLLDIQSTTIAWVPREI